MTFSCKNPSCYAIPFITTKNCRIVFIVRIKDEIISRWILGKIKKRYKQTSRLIFWIRLIRIATGLIKSLMFGSIITNISLIDKCLIWNGNKNSYHRFLFLFVPKVEMEPSLSCPCLGLQFIGMKVNILSSL